MITFGVRVDVVTSHSEILAVDAKIVFLILFLISKAMVHELAVAFE